MRRGSTAASAVEPPSRGVVAPNSVGSLREALDCDPGFPWYRALEGRDISLASLGRIPAGRWLTTKAAALLERLRVAPAGASKACIILNEAADALVAAGERGTFTPCFRVHARKPDIAL